MGRPDIRGSLYIKGGSLVFAALSDGLMSYCLVLSCGVLFLVRVGVCFCVGGNRRKGGNLTMPRSLAQDANPFGKCQR